MQLVAYGAQDVYLTGNPQITFFKVVYRRSTNFSMESIEQTFNGSADFGKRVQAVVSRNGDLIHRTYLQVDLPTVTVPALTAFRWLNWVGHTLISTVDVEIGGQRIDRHYSTFLHIWNELTQSAGHQLGYANMVGNSPQLTTPVENKASSGTKTVPGKTLFIPLQFWFSRNSGLALPLIALQYHEVRITVEFAPVTDLYWAATWNPSSSQYTTNLSAVSVPSLGYASLWIDYVYLDTDERRRFAQTSHEYLIEQLQYTGAENSSQRNIKLNYNHPTKELIWVVQLSQNTLDSAPAGKQWYNFTDDYDYTYAWVDPTYSSSNLFYTPSGGLNLFDPQGSAGNDAGTMPGIAAGGANQVFIPISFEGGDNPVAVAKLQLNGHDRFQERPGRYFNLVQPFQHHENIPSNGINVYSFALKPEEHQPSGTCNFSRIDNATLQLTLTSKAQAVPGNVFIYAINYNVLRIMSGMGGLAYSN